MTQWQDLGPNSEHQPLEAGRVLEYRIPLSYTLRSDWSCRNNGRKNKVLSNHPDWEMRRFIKIPKTSYRPHLKVWLNPQIRKLIKKFKQHKVNYTATIERDDDGNRIYVARG